MSEKFFRQYRAGLRRLLAVLGKDHPRINEVLILQHQMIQNLADTEKHGTTSALETSRARILESCNRISQTLVGKSFYAMCGLSPQVRKDTGILKSEKEELASIDAYFDELNALLETSDLRDPQASTEMRSTARDHTLSILKTLDGVQKGHVVQFLYETGLITEGPGVIFLSEADLSETHLEGASLIEAHLAGSDLRDAHLDAAHLEWARLGEAHLENASLKRTFLVATHLARAHLQEAHLENAHLLGANLSGADCTNARFDGAQMQWAILLTANLAGAYMAHANLIGAELMSANLANANLSGANLEDAHLSWSRMRGTIYDQHTIWPAGFDPISAGAIKVEDE